MQKYKQRTKPIPKIQPKGRGGPLGYLGIIDPPRNRPFIRPYNLQGLKYFQYGTQQIYKQQHQEDKYDKQLLEAQDYSKYLARLMLNLRRQRGFPTQLFSHAYRSYNTYKNRNYGLYDKIRPQTGELVYNPLFQTYGERRTFFYPRPHWWNIRDPYFYSERIFPKAREDRARRDFYIKQAERLSQIPPFLNYPQLPTRPPRKRLNYPTFFTGGNEIWIQTKRKKKFFKTFRKKSSTGYWNYPSQTYRSTKRHYRRRDSRRLRQPYNYYTSRMYRSSRRRS